MESDSNMQEDETENNILMEEPVAYLLQENVQGERSIINETNTDQSHGKRRREEDEEEEWTQVGRSGKRLTSRVTVDVYLSSNEKLPKQFAFAKLLQKHNIKDVSRIKYVSPYKIFIQFDSFESAEELIRCKALQDLGFRCQKPMEVDTSYGVIKDVELEMSEEDMMQVISSTCELTAVKRLKRRNMEGTGWEVSESVRLGFKGQSLPTSVYIYGMRINVEPYVFPVSQCSRCWRFGHVLRYCPSKKVVCPKCGKGHSNCESTTLKCVNCSGDHIVLDRSCPAFKKEKRLRTLMAEFNCSYRKALQVYVPPEPLVTAPPPNLPTPASGLPESVPGRTLPVTLNSREMTYANAVRSAPRSRDEAPPPPQHPPIDIISPLPGRSRKKRDRKKNRNQNQLLDWDISSESDVFNEDIIFDESEGENQEREKKEKKERRDKNKSKMNLSLLLKKLFVVFSNSQTDLKSKIVEGVEIAIEWVVSSLGQCIWDLPFKNFLVSNE